MGVLSVLGLDEAQQGVYEALALVGSATPADLVRSTGCAPAVVADALQGLAGRGLVEALLGGEERWAVTPPEPALDALVHEQEQALARVRAHAQRLRDQALQVAARRPHELVALAEGSATVISYYEQLQRAAQHEVLVFDRPPYPATGGGSPNPLQAQRIAAGVRYRGLYDSEVLDNPAMFGRVQTDIASGEEARVLKGVPLKLAIADRTMALLPLTEPDETNEMVTLVIRPSVLLESLAALFEALWVRGTPVGMGLRQVPDVDPKLVEVVRLLAVGMSDARIARQLGSSERTVRRKVAEAMEVLGASSRFQAGARASELGWLRDS